MNITGSSSVYAPTPCALLLQEALRYMHQHHVHCYYRKLFGICTNTMCTATISGEQKVIGNQMEQQSSSFNFTTKFLKTKAQLCRALSSRPLQLLQQYSSKHATTIVQSRTEPAHPRPLFEFQIASLALALENLSET